MDTKLKSVDKVTVHVLDDNNIDTLSTVPKELLLKCDDNDLAKNNKKAEKCTLEKKYSASGGLSFFITVFANGKKQHLLFDAGMNEQNLLSNMSNLNIDVTMINEIVISHAHFDHFAGLTGILSLYQKEIEQKSKISKKIKLHLNDDMLYKRGIKHENGEYEIFPGQLDIEELNALGANIINKKESRLLLNDFAYLSSEIPRNTKYEKGISNGVKLVNGKWEPDPYIFDERCLIIKLKSKGILIFTGCSHSGLVNILNYVQTVFPDDPLFLVMGGLHLAGEGNEKNINKTIFDLNNFSINYIIPSHCTGYRAINALANSFGDSIVVPSSVGKIFCFS